MKSIQMIALILWVAIFVVAAFVLGQFLVSKDIFDVTGILTINDTQENEQETGKDDIISIDDEEVINKIGQETVRIGQNVANEYFLNYYKEYVNYILLDTIKYPMNEKVTITDDLASDYVFYALSNKVDDEKYKYEENNNVITVSEADLNAFADKLFQKKIDETYKVRNEYGYDTNEKAYNIKVSNDKQEYIQELVAIKNITSNNIELQFECQNLEKDYNNKQSIKKYQVNIDVVYKGGRYIVTDVQKIEK